MQPCSLIRSFMHATCSLTGNKKPGGSINPIRTTSSYGKTGNPRGRETHPDQGCLRVSITGIMGLTPPV